MEEIWLSIRNTPAKKCESCSGSLKLTRLNFEEAIWQCQSAGCLFPLDSPHFDSFFVSLRPNLAIQDRAGRAGSSALVSRSNEIEIDVSQHVPVRATVNEPEPFPLEGFAASAEGDGPELTVPPIVLEELFGPDLVSLPGDLDMPASAPSRSSGEPPKQRHLLSDDEDENDCEDSDGTDEAMQVAQLLGSLPHACRARSPPPSSVSPSIVVSNSSQDTVVSSATPSIATSCRVDKRPRTSEEDIGSLMASAWEDASDEEIPRGATPPWPPRKQQRLPRCASKGKC